MDLPQVGLHHEGIRRVLAVQKNSAPNPQRLLVAEGLWAQDVVLRAEVPIDTFFWCPEVARGPDALRRAESCAARAARSFRVSAKVMERIAERDSPDGLLSLVPLPQRDPAGPELARAGLVVVADSLEIPGNLGTLIRTLDAAGADCLILTNRRTRLTHPKVFRASQGTVLTLPILELATPADALSWLHAHRFRVLLADTRDAQNYRSLDYARGRTAFVIGSERHGIHRDWYASPHERVFVPMLGQGDSLNLSIAAAVLVFEARAQLDRW